MISRSAMDEVGSLSLDQYVNGQVCFRGLWKIKHENKQVD